ncbi:hypothetical protein F4814DRAFT_444645 [Daldinia grandis]|nr:hypothetical protein F4814DRAFT_444645 [Daldinia grandis]
MLFNIIFLAIGATAIALPEKADCPRIRCIDGVNECGSNQVRQMLRHVHAFPAESSTMSGGYIGPDDIASRNINCIALHQHRNFLRRLSSQLWIASYRHPHLWRVLPSLWPYADFLASAMPRANPNVG